MDETFHPSSSIPASSPAAPGPPAGALAMSVSPVAGGGGPSSRSNVSNSNIDFERILKGKTNYVDIDIKNENDGNNSITSINVSMVQDLIASYTLSPPRRSTTKPPTEAVMTLSQALARSIFYEIDGIKFRLPEKKIKLDFLSRVNSMKDLRDGSCFGPGRILFDENGELILDEKVLSQLPAGIGQEYTSHIEELFGGGGGDDDEATRTAATTTSTLSSSSTTVIVENHQQAAAAGRGGGNVAAKLLLAADVLGSVEHLPRVEAPKKRLRCSDEEADEVKNSRVGEGRGCWCGIYFSYNIVVDCNIKNAGRDCRTYAKAENPDSKRILEMI